MSVSLLVSLISAVLCAVIVLVSRVFRTTFRDSALRVEMPWPRVRFEKTTPDAVDSIAAILNSRRASAEESPPPEPPPADRELQEGWTKKYRSGAEKLNPGTPVPRKRRSPKQSKPWYTTVLWAVIVLFIVCLTGAVIAGLISVPEANAKSRDSVVNLCSTLSQMFGGGLVGLIAGRASK